MKESISVISRLVLRSGRVVSSCMVSVSLLLTISTSAHAQGQIASGIITSTGSGPYSYNLSFTDSGTATAPIGSVWYAWVPGQFFLPSMPTTASAPAGWTATISGNSIQFVASSAANDIAIGHTLSGFSYGATFSPSQLAAAPSSGESVAYSGGLFSDSGNTFTVQPTVVPEPSSIALFALGGIGFVLARGTKTKPARALKI